MLFDCPRSIQLANEQRFFEVESDNIYLSDPYDPSPINLLGKRLVAEDEYFPFLYFKCLFEGYHSLVLFVDRSGSQLVAWKVNHKFPIEYVGQFQIPLSDLRFLLALVDASFDEIKQTIFRSATSAPEWARNVLHTLIINLSTFSGLDECLPSRPDYVSLPQDIFSPYIFAVNVSIPSLVDFICHNVAPQDSRQILHLFDAVNSRIGSDFVTDFSQIARYCILRELVCAITGKHVVLDPFAWQHVFSDRMALCSTTYYDKYPLVKSRLIRYKSSLGHYFVERRGPAWLDVTSAIILPNGFLVNVQTGQQWGPCITEDEAKMVQELFSSDPGPLDEEATQFLISEVVSGDNLGHTLWNEVSGYVEFILACQDAGWSPTGIKPILPSSIPSRFSKLGVRSSFYPYIQKSLQSHATPPMESGIIKNYLDSIDQYELPSQFFVEKQVVSFRYPRVSSAVARTICNDFLLTDRSKIRLYKNIRFHNKAHTNTAECLHELFGQLALQSDPRLHPTNIELDLEYSDRVEEAIQEVILACQQHGVALNLCEAYELPELLQVVSSSSISIVPIGSGAVLPTWVFHKHTVLHSEAAHRGQIAWWHLAGNSDPTRQYIVPDEAIHDDPATAGTAYSNYYIDPKAYAATIIIALQDYLVAYGHASSADI